MDLGQDIAGASVNDPELAEVQVVNPRQIMINAKRAGTTTMIFWDPQNRISFYRLEIGSSLGVTVQGPSQEGEKSTAAAPMLRIQFQVGQSRLVDLETAVNRVVISDPEMADVQVITPRQVLVNGKRPGLATLILMTSEGKSIFYDLEINVNIGQIRERLAALIPQSKIVVSGARDGVILSGEVTDLEEMNNALAIVRAYTDKTTNLLRVGGSQQVQLEVQIAEVSRSAMRKLGLNFVSHGDKLSIGYTGRGAGTDATRPTVLDAFQVAVGIRGDSLGGILSLMEGQGLSKTLATPTLIAMSGQEASFLAGGEFPVPVAQRENTITIEYKEFGIRLKFLPTVIGRETISMKVLPEVSNLDFTAAVNVGGLSVPGLTTRRAETTVQLKDGQGFAIAGLLSDRVVSQIDKIPVLGSIPIIGALFRSVQYQREETELLIVVTPKLAQPVEAKQMPPLPGEDQSFDPDNARLFLLGTLKGESLEKVKAQPSAGPSGAVGVDK
ncbi:MAG: pilus assembly protein N-terminal domain-containing protein [Nitrospirae bacterium]|nr:pilus assembly protein N-terminal domain-containing protein [Nitrospirota bacterium]